jgi:hypothetical protein
MTPPSSAFPQVTISREHREALHMAVLADLIDVNDIGTSIVSGRMSEARQGRDRFVRDMRLLDDLGWEAEDERKRFAMTMPAIDLEQMMGYLDAIARAQLQYWTEDLEHAASLELELAEALDLGEDARRRITADLATIGACASVLFDLSHRDSRAGEGAAARD